MTPWLTSALAISNARIGYQYEVSVRSGAISDHIQSKPDSQTGKESLPNYVATKRFLLFEINEQKYFRTFFPFLQTSKYMGELP